MENFKRTDMIVKHKLNRKHSSLLQLLFLLGLCFCTANQPWPQVVKNWIDWSSYLRPLKFSPDSVRPRGVENCWKINMKEIKAWDLPATGPSNTSSDMKGYKGFKREVLVCFFLYGLNATRRLKWLNWGKAQRHWSWLHRSSRSIDTGIYCTRGSRWRLCKDATERIQSQNQAASLIYWVSIESAKVRVESTPKDGGNVFCQDPVQLSDTSQHDI